VLGTKIHGAMLGAKIHGAMLPATSAPRRQGRRLWRQDKGPFLEIFPPGAYLRESFKKRAKNKKVGGDVSTEHPRSGISSNISFVPRSWRRSRPYGKVGCAVRAGAMLRLLYATIDSFWHQAIRSSER
jgi:hypothetical protein